MKLLLVTGAAGRIGSRFVQEYGEHYDLRLTDFKAPEDAEMKHAGEWVPGNLDNLEFVRECVQGMDAVLHLAANPSGEASFEELLPNNVVTTYNVFQSAKQAGVKRVVFASSIQAVYGYPEGETITPDMPPRPTNLYGASKAWGEALCSVYATQGMSSIAVRIGAFMAPEQLAEVDEQMKKEFVGEDDLSQLFHLILQAPEDMKFQVFHGLSDNAVKRIDISETKEKLGYQPEHAAVPPEE